MEKHLLLVIFLLVSTGCASPKSDLREDSEKNEIQAARFREYGVVPTLPNANRKKSNSLMYSSASPCKVIDGDSIKKLDLLKIYNESSFVSAKEKSVFSEREVKVFEFFAYKVQGSKSAQAKNNFLEILGQKSTEIMKDLQGEIIFRLKSNQEKVNFSIIFESQDIPSNFEGCNKIQDITEEVLSLLEEK